MKLTEIDLNKSYTFCVSSSGFIPNIIKDMSEKDIDLYKIELPREEIPTHVAMYINGFVYESHQKWNGTKKIDLNTWITQNKKAFVYCFETDFDLKILEHFIKFNPNYSLVDIVRLAANEITGHIKDDTLFNNGAGMVCSEYWAYSTITKTSVCDLCDLPTYQVKPIHARIYELLKGGK